MAPQERNDSLPEVPTLESLQCDATSSSQNQNSTPSQLKDANENGISNKGYQMDSGDDKPAKPNTTLDKRKLPPPNPTETDSIDFDDLLPIIGEFGVYQWILTALMIPFTFFVSFVYFTQIFLTITPDKHWCMVPELQNLTIEQRINLSIPMGANGVRDKCRVYDVDWSRFLQENSSLEPDPTWKTTSCHHGWEYDLTEVPYPTIGTELHWVCDDSSKQAQAQAIFFVGAIVGGLFFGWIADKYGRIPALIGTNMFGFVGGIASAFCNSFWAFSITRFLVGVAFDNCFTMVYILVLEYVGPKYRTFVANMSIALFFTMASCLLPWLALYLENWRWLTVVTSAPLGFAILTPFLIPESARWLMSKGKINKTITILKKIEKVNKRRIPEKVMDKFMKSSEKESEETIANYSVLDLFKTPRLRKITIILIGIWMIISLVFDGHVRNVGGLGLNIFLTFTVASATELPADVFLIFVLDRWGRRWLAFGCMFLSGLFSLIATTTSLGPTFATFAIIGRFLVNIAYNIGLQYASELLPTVVRGQGVALIHIAGYVASLIAPFIVLLSEYHVALPLLVLGVLGIIGGVLCLFLPETVNEALPQDLQDGEDFGKDQKFWNFPCISKKEEDPEIEHPEIYMRRASSIVSIRSTLGRNSVFARSGTFGRASVRASIRTESKFDMRHRTVSMSSNGNEMP